MSSLSAPIRFLIYPSLGGVREHVRAEFFGRALSQRSGLPIVVELARTYEQVVQELDAVLAGQPLIILEAMKMEIRVAAPTGGTVREVLVKKGDVVEREQQLLALD